MLAEAVICVLMLALWIDRRPGVHARSTVGNTDPSLGYELSAARVASTCYTCRSS